MYLTVKQAGRLGGITVLAKYGRNHFSEIGRKGQLSLRDKHPGMARIWGRKGGRPRKPNLDGMGDRVKKS